MTKRRRKLLRILVHLKWFFFGEALIIFEDEQRCTVCSGSKYTMAHAGDEICWGCNGKGKIRKRKKLPRGRALTDNEVQALRVRARKYAKENGNYLQSVELKIDKHDNS